MTYLNLLCAGLRLSYLKIYRGTFQKLYYRRIVLNLNVSPMRGRLNASSRAKTIIHIPVPQNIYNQRHSIQPPQAGRKQQPRQSLDTRLHSQAIHVQSGPAASFRCLPLFLSPIVEFVPAARINYLSLALQLSGVQTVDSVHDSGPGDTHGEQTHVPLIFK